MTGFTLPAEPWGGLRLPSWTTKGGDAARCSFIKILHYIAALGELFPADTQLHGQQSEHPGRI